jgi:hypothetical protein
LSGNDFRHLDQRRNAMRRTAAILALVAVVSLFGASDVRGGAAGTPAGKTTGPAVVATVVMDITGSGTTPPKGLTSIRVQRSGSSAAALFTMNNVPSVSCATVLAEIQSRFEGLLIDVWVPSAVRTALFGSLADKAAVTDTDYAICNTVDGREYLSFTAVIQFQQK